jgi:AraC-like DNA-binding protein
MIQELFSDLAQRHYALPVCVPNEDGSGLADIYAQRNNAIRLIISLEGERRHRFTVDGIAREVSLSRNEWILIPPKVWLETWYTRDNSAVSINIYPTHIRIIQLEAVMQQGEERKFQGTPVDALELDFLSEQLQGIRILSSSFFRTSPAGAYPPLFDNPDYCSHFLYLLLHHIDGELSRKSAASHSSAGSRSTLSWRRIKNYLEENFSGPLSRGTAAADLGLSESHISRIFREKGTTFSRYLTRKRLSLARELLHSSPELSVLQISDLCGYDSPTYFFRIFKREAGMTPMEYRMSGSRGEP